MNIRYLKKKSDILIEETPIKKKLVLFCGSEITWEE